jgi:hypothetical protein
VQSIHDPSRDVNPNFSKVSDFLDFLWRGADDGRYAYLWADKKSAWFPVSNLRATLAQLPENAEDVYFGVHPQTRIPPTNSRGEAVSNVYIKGQSAYVAAVNCLYAEWDNTDIERITEILRANGLPLPSVLVSSGGGFHGYWLLNTYYTGPSMSRIAIAQKLWVQKVGGDLNAHDLARVLRLPGTLNTKYDPPRPVEFVWYAFDEWFALTELVSSEEIDSELAHQKARAEIVRTATPEQIADAATALNRLNPSRRDNYQQWVEVGMALSELGEVGYALWDGWSQGSGKYDPATTREKWASFTPGEGLRLSSLFHWVNEDNPPAPITPTTNGAVAPATHDGYGLIPFNTKKAPSTMEYIKALEGLGYEFRMNDLEDVIEVGGVPMSDGMAASIRTVMQDYGYRQSRRVEDAYLAYADKHRYHPVRDALNALEWDRQDWIGRLCSMLTETQGAVQYKDGTTLPWKQVALTRWLVGAVAKAFGTGQNMMLVLNSRGQGVGKSSLVEWIAKVLPEYYREGEILPHDKDHQLALAKRLVWQVGELGATTRKADREALKDFLTRSQIEVRRAYGRYDTRKPTMCSFIGTLNDENGFLTDPTGNRRFYVLNLAHIDFSYREIVPVQQVWAQAVQMYRDGAPSILLPEEAEKQRQTNSHYEVQDAVEELFYRFFILDAEHQEWTSVTDIVLHLQAHGYQGNTHALSMSLGRVFSKLGLERADDPKGSRARGYFGIRKNLQGML